MREYNSCYRQTNKDALLEYDRFRYAADIDANRAARRSSYRKHSTKRRQTSKDWYERNWERARRAREAWARENPGIMRESKREWKQRHKDKMLAAKHRRRARILKAPGNGVTAAQWRECVSAHCGLCSYCGERCRPTLDHVVPLIAGGAHDESNITVACLACNSSKSHTPLVVWLAKKAA